MQIPRRKSEEMKKRDTGLVYLTREGFASLKQKLVRLKAALPRLITETQRTAAFGDRSDNAEYKAAKGALRCTNWQILETEDELKRVVIIPSGSSASGKVQPGSTVTLEKDGKQVTFHIVGPYETNPTVGRISHVSPLGAALLGHMKGDSVTVRAGNGSQEYKVLGVQ